MKSRAERIEVMRHAHVHGRPVKDATVEAMKTAIVASRFATEEEPTRAAPAVRMVADTTWIADKRSPGCQHVWSDFQDMWKRCKRCGFFMARKLGTPPKLERLPAILKDRPLPPYSAAEEQHILFGSSLITKAKIDICDRLRIAQCWSSYGPPDIFWFDIEVRMLRGWVYVGNFIETKWHRIIDATEDFTIRDPMEVYVAVQIALYGSSNISSVAISLNSPKRSS